MKKLTFENEHIIIQRLPQTSYLSFYFKETDEFYEMNTDRYLSFDEWKGAMLACAVFSRKSSEEEIEKLGCFMKDVDIKEDPSINYQLLRCFHDDETIERMCNYK